MEGQRSLASLYVSAMLLSLAALIAAVLYVVPLPDASLEARSNTLTGLRIPGQLARLKSRNNAPFEGGNIGAIKKTAANAWELHLRSDNDDALPKFWRRWFYLKLDNVDPDETSTLRIKGAGQWGYYLPVYSYDGKKWQQLSEAEVTQPSRFELEIKKRFRSSTVYLVRYHPYTYTQLRRYLAKLEADPNVRLGSAGKTPEGRELPFLTIGEPRNAREKRAKIGRVFIHARTHPGEVGSSFLLEGFLDYLRGTSRLATKLREKLVVDVLPMLNVDGVVAGNNRVNPRGINLEGRWHPVEGASPLAIDPDKAPAEVQLLHEKLTSRLEDGIPVTVALNLHSSGGEPEDQMFFFPHFGPAELGYDAAESVLWTKQLRFIRHFVATQGDRWFNPLPADGTRAFLAKNVPESWWWRNFKDGVMAISIESTYGRTPDGKRWVSPADMRQMGAAMAKALAKYHDL